MIRIESRQTLVTSSHEAINLELYLAGLHSRRDGIDERMNENLDSRSGSSYTLKVEAKVK